MAQGALKKTSNPKLDQKSKRSKSQTTKPGNRVVKAKKANLVAQNKLIKKHSGGLIALTEKNLAERAGHLELLKGGKKDNKTKAEAQRQKKQK